MSFFSHLERMKRRISREFALQVLFSLDFVGAEANIKSKMSLFEIPEDDEFCWSLVDGVRSHIEIIDGILQNKLLKWTISRLNPVDRNCLRLGIYEITILKQDRALVINEYIEIARKFGDTDSTRFVNGVLDSL